jgi:hypothetical protein
MKRHTKKNDLAELLKNKNVLYVVFFFTIANLFSYLMMKKLDAVAFFIIIGFLATYFSKNMIVVMLTAVISTFFLVQINLLGNVQEGMEGAKPDAKADTPETTLVAPETTVAKTETTGPAASAEPAPTMTAPADATPGTAISGKERAKITATTTETMKNKAESFTQPLSPARFNASDDDDEPRHKPKVDYAGTLESAYDNLDKLLSSDAIKSMSEDTGRLAEKQRQLMGSIEKIQPVMDKAKGILDGFDMTSISKMMESIGKSTDMLKMKTEKE